MVPAQLRLDQIFGMLDILHTPSHCWLAHECALEQFTHANRHSLERYDLQKLSQTIRSGLKSCELGIRVVGEFI